MKNLFLQELSKYDTTTENGALSHSSTGSVFIDQFAKAGTFIDHKLMGRTQDNINTDMALLWNENPDLAMRFVFYLRMITRKNMGVFKTETVQKGQGLRTEAFMRLLWVAERHPKVFERNLALIPEVGSWKDLITLWEMNSDLVDINLIFELYRTVFDMDNSFHTENIKKYLPTLRSRKSLTSPHKRKMREFANKFMEFFGFSEREYRKFKASGESHKFQRLICSKEFNKLNFNRIAGKALFKLATSRGKDGRTFFERHGLEKEYIKYLESQPVAKFTGYPFELMSKAKGNVTLAEKLTIDKQFDGLIKTAKEDGGGIKGNVWCALDTSYSMGTQVKSGISAYDVCISLGIYFSTLNEGAFKDNVIMFDSTSRKMKLAGTFTEKVKQIQGSSMVWGSTNFQSVIDEIVRVRKQNPNIPVSEYPETLLVVSDMQLNPSNGGGTGDERTNYEMAMKKLREVGLPKMTIVWWFVTGRGTDFPSRIDDEGTIMIGGFDGAIMTLLLGGDEVVDEKTGKKRKPTPEEAMMQTLNQELLQHVSANV